MEASNITARTDKFQNSFSLPLLLTSSLILIQTIHTAATNTIDSGHAIRDGETMVSSGGTFAVGFFSPGTSKNRYLGMWYNNIADNTIVWVANREVPLTATSGVLKVVEPGVLVLVNETGGVIWSSTTTRSVRNPVAQLLDSGNLVVKDANDDSPENFLWQSFDYPSDTHLPGMRFGWNLVTGVETYLSSWRSSDDPAPGEFTVHLEPAGYPQVFVRRGGAVWYRNGPWIGLRFSGTPDSTRDHKYRLMFRMSKNEVTYAFDVIEGSVIARSTLSQNGVLQHRIWNHRTQAWIIYTNMPADNCDSYKLCGAHGICNIGSFPACTCLDRFVPRDAESWSRADWSNGCIRRAALNCEDDVFLKYSGIKLPDSQYSWFSDQSLMLDECKAECLRNCSCTAYTRLDIRERGKGCLFYYGDLIDIRAVPQCGQDLYVRMASSELANVAASQANKTTILIASMATGSGMGFLVLCLFLHIRKRRNDSKMRKGGKLFATKEVSELPLFKYSVIVKATNYFSDSNKLGEGGFGPVFKGTLEDGQEIAVKRLSSMSTQGIDEFKNEVIFIAKLQHRNLVRLLGCCIHGEEYMLVYEYMPHKSLDCVLFDQTKSLLLDWPTRFHIISGIARGLLYLHQDSRLRIIHRDLKASNILLDSNMNPKISDFGTARSFGGNEAATRTRQVVGTYGYMSPEYVVDGLFSIKSDVFSFGVVVLEIVSGKRNRGFSHSDHHLNLLGHAWTLYKEERSLDLIDTSLVGTFDLSEVLRSIHVGLLCVQKKAEDRPVMSSVVLMLGSEGALPPANQPGFFTEREVMSTSSMNSINEVTITVPEGR